MDELKTRRLKYNTERQNNEYFINRYGKVIKYTGDLDRDICSMHSEIASEGFPDAKYPSDVIMKLGWVMVGSSVYSDPIIKINPTQSQLNALDKLGLYDRLHFSHEGHYVSWAKYGILCA